MARAKPREASKWSSDCAPLIAALSAASKQLKELSVDPFSALKDIDKTRDVLSNSGLGAHELVERTREGIAAECVRSEAEFWGMLVQACQREGWSVLGNTNRRLVSKAIFVSLDAHAVTIEGVSSHFTPFVPSVMPALASELSELRTSASNLALFLALVARAHDELARAGKGSGLEDLYRQCLLSAQTTAFWRNPTSRGFVRLSRSSFRYRLSEVLRTGVSTPDGRVVQLGTTTSATEAWELYSPGEDRVVLAGRLHLAPIGERRED